MRLSDTLDRLDKSQWEKGDDGEPQDPWKPANRIVLVRQDTEEFYTFSTTAKGSLGALGKLSKAYGEHLRQKPDEYPIIALEGDSYQHPIRSRGRIKFPIFRVVGYVPVKDLPLLEGEQPRIEGDNENAKPF